MPEAVAAGAPSTVRGALAIADDRLARRGVDTPRLDAELLLGAVLGVSRSGLALDADRMLPAIVLARYDGLLRRREAREPVAYVLGRRGFRGIELEVDARVLIPRPETELLVEAALTLPERARVADVGTGSGAVALALAHERPDLIVRGLDVSPDALAVARGNRERLGLLEVEFAAADLLDGGHYDAVLANLPYVANPEREGLAPEITRYEPEVALFGGVDGLDLIRRLVSRLGDGVRFVGLEVGHDQGEAVAALLAASGFAVVERRRDLGGHERVVTGRW